MSIADLTRREWDVIVIGAGMGGGTVGRRLAERGLSVLYVERGPQARRAEQNAVTAGIADPTARLIRGYWPLPIQATVEGRQFDFFGPVGAGVGGSSAFYAATLERPHRHEVDDSVERPHPSGGWPIGYDAFTPYFEDAERLFHVCGEPDPLSDEPPSPLAKPPEMSPGDQALKACFERAGLHPYHSHTAIRYLPGCGECIGRRCPRQCKMDGRSAGVEPALATGRAAVLDRSAVRRLVGTPDRVTHVEAERDGAILMLKARRFVLAAGPLASPGLLLASAAEHWPDGCANHSGLVGHNLMFHIDERVAIWPPKGLDFTGPVKTIAFSDLKHVDGTRLGHFQTVGLEASYPNILHHLKQTFDQSALRRLRPLREFVRIPAFLAAKIFGSARVYAAIIEDLPYAHNRVVFDPSQPDQLAFEYTFASELLERRRTFRRTMRKRLKGLRHFFLNFEPVLNYGHGCGTLRFGMDPATSVLDPDCRAHGITNLYVADASFMPTSNGVNPSLTIAANALRVADRIVDQAREGGT